MKSLLVFYGKKILEKVEIFNKISFSRFGTSFQFDDNYNVSK